MKILIINLSPWPVGGFASVTAHAYNCLKATRQDVQVVRLLNDKTEQFNRKMLYGVPYRNLSVRECVKLLNRGCVGLVTGVARKKDMKEAYTIERLVDAGAKVVIHGYTEHKQFDHLDYVGTNNAGVCIRKSMCGVYSGIEQYLPHPYQRVFSSNRAAPLKGRKRAGSVAMVVPHKNPAIILEANRILKNSQIEFRGNEDRMFTRFKLMKDYPEYKMRNKFPAKINPAEICAEYQIMIDLTVFGKGNGGTQYAFMEAIDARAICIIHREWTRDEGEMENGTNCLTVSNSKELAKLVKELDYFSTLLKLQKGYNTLLDQHGPSTFTKALLKLFGKDQ